MTPQQLTLQREQTAPLQFLVTSLTSQGLTGYTHIYFTLRRSPNSPILAQKDLTTGVSIVVAGDATTPGQVQVILAPSDTTPLALYDYLTYWDCVGIDPNGYRFPLAYGTLLTKANQSRAS